MPSNSSPWEQTQSCAALGNRPSSARGCTYPAWPELWAVAFSYNILCGSKEHVNLNQKPERMKTSNTCLGSKAPGHLPSASLLHLVRGCEREHRLCCPRGQAQRGNTHPQSRPTASVGPHPFPESAAGSSSI